MTLIMNNFVSLHQIYTINFLCHNIRKFILLRLRQASRCHFWLWHILWSFRDPYHKQFPSTRYTPLSPLLSILALLSSTKLHRASSMIFFVIHHCPISFKWKFKTKQIILKKIDKNSMPISLFCLLSIIDFSSHFSHFNKRILLIPQWMTIRKL